MNIKILDPNLGVDHILDAEPAASRLPQAKPLVQGGIGGTGLEDLFTLPTFKTVVNSYLKPEIPDEDLLRPDLFGRNLEAALETLREAGHPAVRRFVRDDLGPLLEDARLLKAYAGLMMDG